MSDRRESDAVVHEPLPNGYTPVPLHYDDMTGTPGAVTDYFLDQATQVLDTTLRTIAAFWGVREQKVSVDVEKIDGQGQVVLFVPGRHSDSAAYMPVLRRLEKEFCLDPVLTRVKDVSESASVVRTVVEDTLEAARVSPTQMASLVGHSLGGTIVEEAASHPWTHGIVRSLVMIDAPHDGDVNGILVGRSRSRAGIHPEVAITNLVAAHGLVVPRESSLTHTASDISLPRGHWGILEHPALPKHIARGVLKSR